MSHSAFRPGRAAVWAAWAYGKPSRALAGPARRGGDGWESNPPGTAQHRPTDGFEDRGRHQPPNIPGWLSLPHVARAFFKGPPGASLNSKPALAADFGCFGGLRTTWQEVAEEMESP